DRTSTETPQYSVSAAGFEPAFSCSQSTRTSHFSHTPMMPAHGVCGLLSERPAGVEPALPPWQGSRLPLHHGRVEHNRIVKHPVGPEGLEPSPSRLRAGHAAANTLIPICFPSGSPEDRTQRAPVISRSW